MDWTRLPLARGSVGRAAHRRLEPDVLTRSWRSERTRVVLVADGRVATRAAAGTEGTGDAGTNGVRLDLYPPSSLSHLLPGGPGTDGSGGPPLLLFLGEVEENRAVGSGVESRTRGNGTDPTDAGDDPGAYLALVLPDRPSPSGTGVGIEGVPDLSDASGMPFRWSTLRDVGHGLDDADAGLAATALGLAAWHLRNPRCPRCGAITVVAQGGWLRRCSVERSEQYPRTDPAVIMAVVDVDDRLLLGHAAHWPERRYSTLAGYVEPGESIEDAVRREVAEEAGIVVGEVVYRGSQPWPFPASLMLAFVAGAITTDAVPDGVELTDVRWFTRAELATAVAGGDVLLPMRASVARALIEDWYGEELPTPGP